MDQEKQNSSFYISPNSTSLCYPLSSWPEIPNSFLSSTKKAMAASNHQGEIFAAKNPGGGKLTPRCQVSKFPSSPHRFSSLLKRGGKPQRKWPTTSQLVVCLARENSAVVWALVVTDPGPLKAQQLQLWTSNRRCTWRGSAGREGLHGAFLGKKISAFQMSKKRFSKIFPTWTHLFQCIQDNHSCSSAGGRSDRDPLGPSVTSGLHVSFALAVK